MATKKSTAGLSPVLQLTFIISVLFVMLSQLIYAILMYLQAPLNTIPPYEWLAISFGLPLAVTIVTFLTRRDRKLSTNSIFETLLLVSSWFLLFSAVSSWVYQLFFSIEAFRQGPSELFTAIQIGMPLLIVGVGLTLTILHLRRKKQW